MSDERIDGGGHITRHESDLTRDERFEAIGQRGVTMWFTGLSGSGKSTVAVAVEKRLLAMGRFVFRLDGDNVRHGLCADLGFDAQSRTENIRRVGEVSALFADSGCVTLSSFISPYRADRAAVRAVHEQAGLTFCEVHVSTPIEVCEARDPKGLYVKARAGEIKGFTGIDDPYEAPDKGGAELVLDTSVVTVDEAADRCIQWLQDGGALLSR